MPWSPSRANARWRRRGGRAGDRRRPLPRAAPRHPLWRQGPAGDVGRHPDDVGRAPLREQRFDFDATVIRKLEEAGAVLCAKLAMVELAGAWATASPMPRSPAPGINPWNPGAWSGGSSSGSARPSRRDSSRSRSARRPGARSFPRWVLRHRGAPAELRPREPSRRHGALLDARQARAPLPHRRGLRPRAGTIAGTDPADPTTSDRPWSYEGADVAGRRFRFGVIKGVATGCDEAVRANFECSLDTLRGIGTCRGGGAAGAALGGDQPDHPGTWRPPAPSRTSSRAGRSRS